MSLTWGNFLCMNEQNDHSDSNLFIIYGNILNAFFNSVK